jgi:predicted Rossmann fold nucleotide-binding protein DprA/Smf involved in DNA uptake
MKYGIVGSRSRNCKKQVFEFVRALPNESVIISGGCRGVDKWAIEAALSMNFKTIEFLPDLPPPGSPKYKFTKAYYERNEKIAQESDVIAAFVSPDRKGGTENTISHAKKLNKPVLIC